MCACVFILVVVLCTQVPGASSMVSSEERYIEMGKLLVPSCGYKSCAMPKKTTQETTTSDVQSSSICECDDNCVIFGDCCYDFFGTSMGKKFRSVVANRTRQVMSALGGTTSGNGRWLQEIITSKACVTLTTNGLIKSYWFVSSCGANDVTQDAILRCKDVNLSVFGRVPVTLISNPSITFANFHCAACHGFRREEVRFWKTNAKCSTLSKPPSTFDEIISYVQQGRCKLQVTPTEHDRPRHCQRQFNSIPPSPGITKLESTEIDMCSVYSYPVELANSRRYINPHCADKLGASDVFGTALRCSSGLHHTTSIPTNMAHKQPLNPFATAAVVNNLPYPTPFPVSFTPAATPYPGPNKYPIGYTPHPGATPYPGPTRYPLGFTPYPSATPYPDPTPYPIRYSAFPNPGQKEYQNTGFGGSGQSSGLTILFNFGQDEMSFDVDGHTVRSTVCQHEDEVYMIYTNRCVKLNCHDPDMRPVNGTCRLRENVVVLNVSELIRSHGSDMFVLGIQVKGKRSTITKITNRMVRRYFSTWVKKRLLNETGKVFESSIDELHRQCNPCRNVKIDDKDQSVVCQYEVAIFTNMSASLFLNETYKSKTLFTKKMRSFNLSATLVKLKNYHHSWFEDLSNYLEYLQDNGSRCSSNETDPRVHVDVEVVSAHKDYYAWLKRKYYKLDDVIFQMVSNPHHPLTVDIILCEEQMMNYSLNCPNGSLSLQPDDFKVVENYLILLPSGVKIDVGDFSLTDFGAEMCNIFSREIPEVRFFNYNTIQSVLSRVSSIVSVISLVLVLLVYSYLPVLRNVPGKIVMCLSATLILAELLLLVIDLPTGYVCTVVASLAHVTWLSSFLWMTMLSVDLARSLRSMSPISAVQNHNKLLFTYMSLAWGLPTLFVTMCILADRYSFLGLSIGYGSDHVCWITNPKASLYLFAIPILASLVVNLICFVFTVATIERTTRGMASKAKSCKNEKIRLGIYIKLSFIMGFSWIFSFVAAFVHLSILTYFQLLLNGLQGLYIFICFVCKTRILKLFVDKYKLSLPSSSRQTEFSKPTTISST